METQSKSGSNRRWIFIIIIVAILAATAVAIVFILSGRKPDESDARPQNVSAAIGADGMPVLGYAQGVTALEEDSLTAAVNEMFEAAERPGFTTEYKNEAYSSDGQTFECYIGNSNLNSHDMFFQISDEAGDQLFLSGLLPPGTALREITLDRALEPGTHRVIVTYTRVEGDLEDMSIIGQVSITMDFIVTG